MDNLQKIIQAFPFERLYVIHRDIKSYQRKWTKKRIIDTVFAPNNELTFTTIQYVNRILSPIGPILIAANYPLGGSVFATTFLYVEFGITYYREKVFKTGETKLKWIELNKDTENLSNSYQELLEILKPINSDNSLSDFHQLINYLKNGASELAKSDREGNSKESALLNLWDNNNLSTRRVVRWFKNLPKILTMQPLPRVSLKAEWWIKEWETRRNKREEVKKLIEFLQQAISKYCQGITEEEIEKEIKKNLWKLASSEVKKLDNMLKNTLEMRKSIFQESKNNIHSLTEVQSRVIFENNAEVGNETNQEVTIPIENHIEIHS